MVPADPPYHLLPERAAAEPPPHRAASRPLPSTPPAELSPSAPPPGLLPERALAGPLPHRAAARTPPHRAAVRTSPRARRRRDLSPSPAASLFCSGHLPPSNHHGSNLPHLALPHVPRLPHHNAISSRWGSAAGAPCPFIATTPDRSTPPPEAVLHLPLLCLVQPAALCPSSASLVHLRNSSQVVARPSCDVFFGWIMLEISHRLLVFVNCDLLWSGHTDDTTDFDPTIPGGCSDGLRVTT